MSMIETGIQDENYTVYVNTAHIVTVFEREADQNGTKFATLVMSNMARVESTYSLGHWLDAIQKG